MVCVVCSTWITRINHLETSLAHLLLLVDLLISFLSWKPVCCSGHPRVANHSLNHHRGHKQHLLSIHSIHWRSWVHWIRSQCCGSRRKRCYQSLLLFLQWFLLRQLHSTRRVLCCLCLWCILPLWWRRCCCRGWHPIDCGRVWSFDWFLPRDLPITSSLWWSSLFDRHMWRLRCMWWVWTTHTSRHRYIHSQLLFTIYSHSIDHQEANTNMNLLLQAPMPLRSSLEPSSEPLHSSQWLASSSSISANHRNPKLMQRNLDRSFKPQVNSPAVTLDPANNW